MLLGILLLWEFSLVLWGILRLLKWEVNREELTNYPAHSMPQIQAPWQDADTDISATAQEMGRVAYMGEDPHGFLCHSQHRGDQADKCSLLQLSKSWGTSIHTSHLQCSQGCCQQETRGQKGSVQIQFYPGGSRYYTWHQRPVLKTGLE